MTPTDDRRVLEGLISAVAALQAGERHTAEDRRAMYDALTATERRLIEAIGEVDDECKEFRGEVRSTWEKERVERKKREEAKDEKNGQRSTALILACIAMVGVLAQSAAAIVGAIT